MTGTELTQLGSVGIIALALLSVVHTMKPLIEAVVVALREGVEARKAVLARWDDSDTTLEKNTGALNNIALSMRELGGGVERLNVTGQQQNEANRTALQDGLSAIRGDLVIAKDDAVNALTNALNTSFTAQGATMSKLLEGDEKAVTEQKQTREHLERLEAKMDAMLDRLNQVHPPPAVTLQATTTETLIITEAPPPTEPKEGTEDHGNTSTTTA